MIGFRVRHSESWLSAQFGPVAAAQLRDRLLERCEGEKGLFLTLTYKRDRYADPQELYQEARERRHVRKFIAKLQRRLGERVAGRWLVKLEFQEGGWVHWHMLLLGVDYLDHAMLTSTWGHGFVWVKRMTPQNIAYTCKYVSKDGELPAFLYLERSRSVRIVRVSPGFWRTSRASRPRERRGIMPWYRTVGEVLEKAEGRVVLRHHETGAYLGNDYKPHEVVGYLAGKPGARCVGYADGFMWWRGVSLADLANIRPTARIWMGEAVDPGTGEVMRVVSGGGRPASASGAGRGAAKPPALHLNITGDPPLHALERPGGKWLGRYFEFEFGWRDVGGAQ